MTLGLLPGNGGTQRLTRLLGPSRAMDLLLTGETFTPEQALEWGLIAELFEDARQRRGLRASGSPPARRWRCATSSAACTRAAQLPLDEGLDARGAS